MNIIQCIRCHQVVEGEFLQTNDGLIYCDACSSNIKESLEARRKEVYQEKKEIIKERNSIENELEFISEEDTRHIIVTTTNHVVDRKIGEYIDIVSIQEIRHSTYEIPRMTEPRSYKDDTAEMLLRSGIELGISKLKKRAYLKGADAVVGVCIESSVNYLNNEKSYILLLTKINITGTAVRLFDLS